MEDFNKSTAQFHSKKYTAASNRYRKLGKTLLVLLGQIEGTCCVDDTRWLFLNHFGTRSNPGLFFDVDIVFEYNDRSIHESV